MCLIKTVFCFPKKKARKIHIKIGRNENLIRFCRIFYKFLFRNSARNALPVNSGSQKQGQIAIFRPFVK